MRRIALALGVVLTLWSATADAGPLHKGARVASFRWEAPAAGSAPTSYRIYWGTSPSTYPNGPHTDVGFDRVELYTALGLAADTTYYVIVRAVNATGEGANSNEIQVRNGAQIGP